MPYSFGLCLPPEAVRWRRLSNTPPASATGELAKHCIRQVFAGTDYPVISRLLSGQGFGSSCTKPGVLTFVQQREIARHH